MSKKTAEILGCIFGAKIGLKSVFFGASNKGDNKGRIKIIGYIENN
jgi:hypothetical protein